MNWFIAILLVFVAVNAEKYQVMVQYATADKDEYVYGYVKVYGYGDTTKEETSKIIDSNDPFDEWDETFDFDGKYESFQFKLYDKNDKCLGETEKVFIDEIKQCDEWYNMQLAVISSDKKEFGIILVAFAKNCDENETLPSINTTSLTKYAKVMLQCDLSSLSKNQQQALLKLREASALMDEIFAYQSSGKSFSEWKENVESEYKNNEENNEYMNGVSKEDYLHFLSINLGPWDRLSDEHGNYPPGVNYYPPDMTVDEFNEYVNSLSDDNEKAQALSFFTIIVRDDQSSQLQYIPYNEAYEKWLKPASKLLRQASDLVENESLKKYLSSRSKAFFSPSNSNSKANVYIESDIKWLNVDKNSKIDVTIGPYETYEDQLLGLKAAFQSRICLTDEEGSAAIQLFSEQLQDLENNLPCDEMYKNKEVVQGKPIVVVDEIATGGEASAGIQIVAVTLPNDVEVTEQYGSKIVILRNIQQAKFENILMRIADVVIHPNQRDLVTFPAWFNHVLCHEMSHSLGPQQSRLALGDLYSTIEELKADIVGVYSLLYLIDKGLFENSSKQEVLVSFLAGCFRAIRFGLNSSHGKGEAIQFNWIIENKGFVYDVESGYFSVDFQNVEDAIISLINIVLEIQANGDKDGAQNLIDNYVVNLEYTQDALTKLQENNIPVDIQPIFEWIGLEQD